MPIFRFMAQVMVSACTEVEAETVEAARAEAEKRSAEIGCGSGADVGDYWLIEDADGEITDIELEDN